ncbi:MAG: hypothetical protein DRN20_00720 [Thermoplasmata archaeon]|nr:MAG: hypothetical protein DRN20_00720 [Thermoplasmata archaeon]
MSVVVAKGAAVVAVALVADMVADMVAGMGAVVVMVADMADSTEADTGVVFSSCPSLPRQRLLPQLLL